MVETPSENRVAKGSRLRHPDSMIFGDADSEPKRITITPKLVQDDANVNSAPNVTPVKPKTSFDKITRREDAFSPPPAKLEKPKKEKKSMSMFSVFKKKKKASKEEEVDDFLHGIEKKSSESLRDDSSGRPSSSRSGGNSIDQSPQFQQGHFQRSEQPLQPSRMQPPHNEKTLSNPPQRQAPEPSAAVKASNTVRTIEPDSDGEDERPLGLKFSNRVQPIDSQQSTVVPAQIESNGRPDLLPASSSIALKSQRQHDINASPISSATATPRSMPPSADVTPIMTSLENYSARPDGYYTETPDDLTPHELPSLIPDNGSGSEGNDPHDISPVEPSHPEVTGPEPHIAPNSPAPVAWSDNALRAYFNEDNQDIRDFLVVVNHKTDVSNVKSHPEITPLFADATSKLKDMTSVRTPSINPQYEYSL